jgi:threonine dehydrogenase-like Zn-dependent dehydrogenase
MKAAVVYGPNDIRIEEYPDPSAGPGEVIIKTKAAGICAKDVRRMLGEGLTLDLPFIPGHDLAGEISAVGSGVKGFFPGEAVAVYPGTLLGYGCNGAYAEYVRIPQEILALDGLLRLDEEISFEDAVMAEPLACTFATARLDGMKEGQQVVIIGGGSVGLMYLKTAKWAGCTVSVADKNATRLALAGQMGADHLIQSNQVSLHEEVMRITGGRGADLVIISVGIPEVIDESIRLTAEGGVCNVFLRPEDQGAMHQQLEGRKITLTGACPSTPGDFKKCLQLIKEEAIIVSDMISHRFTLDSFHEAIEKSKNQELVRGVITFGELFSVSF